MVLLLATVSWRIEFSYASGAFSRAAIAERLHLGRDMVISKCIATFLCPSYGKETRGQDLRECEVPTKATE
jgi:hypothetical protein